MTPGKNTEARPCLVDTRGRVAIPKAILSSLGVKEGDYVTFEQEKDKIVVYAVDWQVKRSRP